MRRRTTVGMGGGRRSRRRRGAALAELALTLPLLLFLLVAATDFARAFHDSVIVTDRARLGALAASQNVGTPGSPRDDASWRAAILAAVAADGGELATPPAVVIAPSALSQVPTGNPYVAITVTSPFRTVMSYPGIPSQLTISRTVRMRLQPTSYRMN